ncbi:spore germination protein [Brevibacillus centrosporus]|jgi:spore germination protein KA|uniref:Spore germination protein KA n=1 Tax=Brevibacillus centrosporus TaxID=54910 RepID=A0A1I3KKL3_9BACL|nr:spore germination protein [Brevibacillus centrosporus]MED4907223.1 spore germination protein [Brevibacillus centrosporus]SFI73051.1 spore germination protein KA [Brevibacillus centrosporus]
MSTEQNAGSVHTSPRLSKSLDQNELLMRNVFTNCYDIVFRRIQVFGQIEVLLIYLDGLVDTKTLEHVLLKPWMLETPRPGLASLDAFDLMVEQQLVSIAKTKTTEAMEEVIESILSANVVILFDETNAAVIAELKGFEKRAIEEPTGETTIRGPREGFTENISVNTSMIRRKIQSPKLKMESMTVGSLSKSTIVIAYIDGIAKTSIIEEVRRRISRIQLDTVLGGNFIEEFIEDYPFTVFPQVQNTERPDIVASCLAERKVAIFIDGTPFVLIVPCSFWSTFQSADDYYERFIYATLIRWLRMLLIIISLFLPSIYVAITTFHPQLLPTNFLLSITSAREGVPFPAVIEAVLMELLFEGLREAGIRMPRPAGSAVSIVGALVIGQAAVQAGIVSAPMVIVVSLTGVASLISPRYSMGMAFRMLRFPMLIFSGMFGLYGVTMATVFLLIHLTNLESFGVPYLSPVAPLTRTELKDVLIRAPRWNLFTLPLSRSIRKKWRFPKGQKPGGNKGDGTQ